MVSGPWTPPGEAVVFRPAGGFDFVRTALECGVGRDIPREVRSGCDRVVDRGVDGPGGFVFPKGRSPLVAIDIFGEGFRPVSLESAEGQPDAVMIERESKPHGIRSVVRLRAPTDEPLIHRLLEEKIEEGDPIGAPSVQRGQKTFAAGHQNPHVQSFGDHPRGGGYENECRDNALTCDNITKDSPMAIR